MQPDIIDLANTKHNSPADYLGAASAANGIGVDDGAATTPAAATATAVSLHILLPSFVTLWLKVA